MEATPSSRAHRRSHSFVIDPDYSSTPPTVVDQEWWLYGEAELECYRLAVLRKRAADAELNVYYPGYYHVPVRRGFFRFKVNTSKDIVFRSNGKLLVRIGERVVYESTQQNPSTLHNIAVYRDDIADDLKRFIVVQVDTTDGQEPPEPPCISMDSSLFTKCEWSPTGESDWSSTKSFPSRTPHLPPHLVEDAKVQVIHPITQIENNLYDFGVELLGHVVFEPIPDSPITLQVGETIQEAKNSDPQHMEQSTSVQQCTETDTTMWQSLHPLAFRYVQVQAKQVFCNARFHPVQYHGAFAASDKLLCKIWMSAAYTLRLCMHDFIVDGIKRDRLPWTGDLAVSLLANAYTFCDAEIVRRTLTVLGRSGIRECDINGIVDYSLWWIITQDLFQLYFGDMEHLSREWSRIQDAIQCLMQRCNEVSGFLEVDSEKNWVFIDWVDTEKATSLQILWWWALGCGIKLAERLNDQDTARQWIKWQETVKDSLVTCCWDCKARLWLAAPNRQGEFSRHANILAVVSGLSSRKNKKIVQALMGTELAAVGTPYMKFFECMALSYGGESCIAEVRRYWGGMLEKGATTFWEAFDLEEPESEIASFYDRPYGRSLCHAWSAGPAQFLPATVLGIRPLQDGWKEWTCHPQPDGLEWVSATVPTPHGSLEVESIGELVRVVVPDGTSLRMNGASFLGPTTISIPLENTREQNVIDSDTLKKWSEPYRHWHYYPDHVIPASPKLEGGEGVKMTDVPTVYQVPDDPTWYMSFIGFDGSGYQSFVAESIDLISWTNMRLAMGYGKEGEFDYGGRVLGAYLYEDYSVDAPRVLKRKDGKFWSLYGAYKSRGGYEIDPGYEGLASSDDGLQWQRAKEDCILSVHSPDVGDWEKDSIYQPWLLEHNNEFFNFYNAKEMPEWIEQIGLAHSSDLFSWTRQAENPVLPVCPNSFDSQFVSDGKVFRDGDRWVMFYFGIGPTWEEGAHIEVAFSTDLIHWSADRQPLYRAGGHPLGLDSEHAHKISLIWNPSNETWYMFYCAVGNKGRGIGLITSNPIKHDV